MPMVKCRCGRMVKYRPEQAGKKAKCPACSAVIALPAITSPLEAPPTLEPDVPPPEVALMEALQGIASRKSPPTSPDTDEEPFHVTAPDAAEPRPEDRRPASLDIVPPPALEAPATALRSKQTSDVPRADATLTEALHRPGAQMAPSHGARSDAADSGAADVDEGVPTATRKEAPPVAELPKAPSPEAALSEDDIAASRSDAGDAAAVDEKPSGDDEYALDMSQAPLPEAPQLVLEEESDEHPSPASLVADAITQRAGSDAAASPSPAELRAFFAERPLAEKPTKKRPNFWLVLPFALFYPLRRGGFSLIVCAVVLVAGVRWAMQFFDIARANPMASYLASGMKYFGLVICGGYFAGYLMQIIADSAQGEKVPPDWPDIMEYVQAVIQPLLYFLAMSAFSFAPAIAYYYLQNRQPNPKVFFLLKALGCLYMPMCLIAVSVFRDPRSLNPWYVIKGIIKVAPRYVATWILTVAALWVVTMLPEYLKRHVVGTTQWHAVARDAIYFGAAFYLLLFVCRVLGLLYYTSWHRLRHLEE